ncbi:hypothetical protein ACFLW6_01735 [Chloroflexota bacterium]
MRSIKRCIAGFGVRDFALRVSADVLATSLGTSINKPNAGLKSREPLDLVAPDSDVKFPEEKPAVTDSAAMTEQIKRVAWYFGADLVGI